MSNFIDSKYVWNQLEFCVAEFKAIIFVIEMTNLHES